MSFSKPKTVGGMLKTTQADQELITAQSCGINLTGDVHINLNGICVTNKSTSTILININNGMYVPVEAGYSVPVDKGSVESIKIKNKGASIHWFGLL